MDMIARFEFDAKTNSNANANAKPLDDLGGLGEEAEGHLGAGEPVDSADPALRAEVREQRERLHAALAGLDATWRAVLYLRDGLSLSYREVGEALGKSEDVVRVTLHRARRRVRQVLMADEPEGEFS